MKNYNYLAGIIDGEGCLKFSKIRARNPHPYPLCRVTNTDKGILGYLQKEFGGKIHPMDRKGRQKAWQWSLRTPEMKVIFPKILPLLKAKEKQELCKKAIEWFNRPRYRP